MGSLSISSPSLELGCVRRGRDARAACWGERKTLYGDSVNMT
jgi:hypothetical protein